MKHLLAEGDDGQWSLYFVSGSRRERRIQIATVRAAQCPRRSDVRKLRFNLRPSVNRDCRYFVHDEDYAGISAFINEPTAKSERNALMLAVGVLVPLSHGRLGKSWKHASALKELARYTHHHSCCIVSE